mmetsp:Transcript_15082/g.31540  ORF Transcript_15082/g.31540 Transcript_15082/m.31540 type:complete len:645 (-) Transcript_15082:89-2023(-)
MKASEEDEDASSSDEEQQSRATVRQRPQAMAVHSPHAPPGWSKLRFQLGRFLDMAAVDVTLAAAILLNMVYITVDMEVREGGEEPPWWLAHWDWIFLTFYMIDIGLRIFVHRLEFFMHLATCADFVIVFVDFLCEVISIFGSTEMPSIAVLRVFRVVRLLRAVQKLTVFRELYLMMHGILSTMKAVFWATFIIIIMLTLWSMVAVEVLHPLNLRVAETGVYEGCERCPRAFQTVLQSNLTFIQSIIAGDSWGQISIPVMEMFPWSSIIFLLVLVSLQLGLMNLILAVIVDRAEQAREEDHEQQLKDKAIKFKRNKTLLKKIFKELDDDSNSTLTLDEILAGYDSTPEFCKALKVMDIQRDDLALVFDIIDIDSNGTVSSEEFVEQLHRMKMQDSHMLLVFIRHQVHRIHHNLHKMMKRATSQRSGGLGGKEASAVVSRGVSRISADSSGSTSMPTTPFQSGRAPAPLESSALLGVLEEKLNDGRVCDPTAAAARVSAEEASNHVGLWPGIQVEALESMVRRLEQELTASLRSLHDLQITALRESSESLDRRMTSLVDGTSIRPMGLDAATVMTASVAPVPAATAVEGYRRGPRPPPLAEGGSSAHQGREWERDSPDISGDGQITCYVPSASPKAPPPRQPPRPK